MSAITQISAHNALDDPLSGSTRSTKRSLVVFSSIALLIVLTGVRPEEVSVFGLRFPGLTISILNGGLLILLGLSIFTFIVYGLSDFFRFRHRMDIYNRCRAGDADKAIHTNPDSCEAQSQQHYEDEFMQMTGYRPFEISHRPTMALTAARLTLDLILPLVFGVVCMLLFIVKHVIP